VICQYAGLTPFTFYEGRCVYAGSLNYILWGHINRLAHDKFKQNPFEIAFGYRVSWSLADALIAVRYHKLIDLHDLSETNLEAQYFTEIGFQGYADEVLYAIGRALKHCDTSHSKVIADSLHGHWGKIKF